MVIEIARLPIQAGREAEFVAAFRQAEGFLSSTEGFRSLRLTRGVESPSEFILLVEWDTLESHTVNFRQSEGFAQWRGLVGPFFAGDPSVAHWVDA